MSTFIGILISECENKTSTPRSTVWIPKKLLLPFNFDSLIALNWIKKRRKEQRWLKTNYVLWWDTNNSSDRAKSTDDKSTFFSEVKLEPSLLCKVFFTVPPQSLSSQEETSCDNSVNLENLQPELLSQLDLKEDR